ncbi:hypothetical protein Y032_0031g2332 [Ancylostoma ceylanicum]|uniref:Uncharacterized protein n=1 Tax=Ancylostoma ceylanicum TaxID=53326 RepID=A0A016UQT7_9BILA|nr:hypothetical protein Y032_0031g2332 [Ancylostoma ceylanicum]
MKRQPSKPMMTCVIGYPIGYVMLRNSGLEVDLLVGLLDDEVEIVAEVLVGAEVWSGVEISDVASVDSDPTDVEGDSACVVSINDGVAESVDGDGEVDGDVGRCTSTSCPVFFHGVVVGEAEKSP